MSVFVRAAVAAALLVTPVLAQVVWPSFGDSGHLVFAAAQLAGWLLLAGVVAGAPGDGVGRRLVLGACVCQVLFALVYGVSAAVLGEPLEAVFVLFLLGFVLQLIGGVAWGRALLREPGLRGAGAAVLATAGLGCLAMLVGVDPWHDVFLLGSYAAWALVGRGLAVAGERVARPALSAESR